MKKVIAIILLSAISVFAQVEKPLTQSEYVKFLYAANTATKRQDLIEVLRKRGISFVLTDGLRGLTKTKGANDLELNRTLEEANRRRENPSNSQPPTAKEASELITKSREVTLVAVDEMPDFVVKQLINRGIGYAGTNNFRSIDKLIVAVSYRAEGKEEYKVLSKNGVVQSDNKAKNSYEEVGGTSSTGEFVTVLATIFKTESQTDFEVLDTDVLRGRKTIIYNFNVEKDKAKQQIVASGNFDESTIAGMKGKIWIDRENFRVLRIESQATEIPDNFPIRAAKRNIDYDWVTIGSEKYILPIFSEVKLTARQDRELYETRNQIRFKEYQKFGTEIKILDDDVVEEEKTKEP
ncbi:MAG: hypothetical protein MUC29_00025 [Pyrinomonadaceae bacterium]|jgi:hypothetical protein|nr:hypothetical protein [Pyrinomonadaceae bacterium]